MSDRTEYRFYYQSSSHGWITLSAAQADELRGVLDEVTRTGRAVVWTMHIADEYWDTTRHFLIGPDVPVRLDVMRPM